MLLFVRTFDQKSNAEVQIILRIICSPKNNQRTKHHAIFSLAKERKMIADELLKTQSAKRKQSQFCTFATHEDKKVWCKQFAAAKQRRRNFMKDNNLLVALNQHSLGKVLWHACHILWPGSSCTFPWFYYGTLKLHVFSAFSWEVDQFQWHFFEQLHVYQCHR